MWIDDYLKLHFPLDPDNMKIEEAIQLKHLHIPTSLYRYRAFNNYNMENLMKEQEWQSYPSEFNDPFDASLKIDYQLLSKELFLSRNIYSILKNLDRHGVKISDEQMQTIHMSEDPIYTFYKHVAKYEDALKGKEDEFAKIISEQVLEETKSIFDNFRSSFRNGYLVVCFSVIRDSILLWSHYAENHKGFCIEYNFKELGPFNPLSRTLNPVIYTDELFDATQYVLRPLIRKDHSFNNLFGIYTSISKSTVWMYEKEWRTVFPLGPNASLEYRFMKVPKPKALYIGAKATENNIEKLKDIAEIKRIPLYKMRLSDTSHNLTVETFLNPMSSMTHSRQEDAVFI